MVSRASSGRKAGRVSTDDAAGASASGRDAGADGLPGAVAGAAARGASLTGGGETVRGHSNQAANSSRAAIQMRGLRMCRRMAGSMVLRRDDTPTPLRWRRDAGCPPVAIARSWRDLKERRSGMTQRDPRVDAYIARQADFARPILDELRRRAGERTRPTPERDYIDRLLRGLY